MDDLSKLNDLNINDFLNKEEKDQLKSLFDEMNSEDWTYDVSDDSVKLNIKIMNMSRNPNPSYQKEGDSGFDFMADIPDDEEIIIEPFKRALIPTGLHFQIPQGFELQVRPRSGLALKHGITVLNSPGTVDSSFRGNVGVILYNTGEDSFKIKKGDRIAQGVIAPIQFRKTVLFTQVNSLDETDRGSGGFGHTGL